MDLPTIIDNKENPEVIGDQRKSATAVRGKGLTAVIGDWLYHTSCCLPKLRLDVWSEACQGWVSPLNDNYPVLDWYLLGVENLKGIFENDDVLLKNRSAGGHRWCFLPMRMGDHLKIGTLEIKCGMRGKWLINKCVKEWMDFLDNDFTTMTSGEFKSCIEKSPIMFILLISCGCY